MKSKPWINKSHNRDNCKLSEWLLQYSTMNESMGSQEFEGYYSPLWGKYSNKGEKYIYQQHITSYI